MWFFHILLYILCRLILIRGVFVDEGSFKFVLQIPIRCEGKAWRIFPEGIQFDQFAGNVLDFRLGLSLEIFPGIGSKLAEDRFRPFLAYIL